MAHNNQELRHYYSRPNDEWYTRYPDVLHEVMYHADAFMGMSVVCPCDGPDSSFTRFFLRNFRRLGLRRLTCIQRGFETQDGRGWIMDVSGVEGGFLGAHCQESCITEFTETHDDAMDGSGDILSDDVWDVIWGSDIVVTNPPFSLWREIYPRLKSAGVHFLMVAPLTMTFSDVAGEDIVSGDVWLGQQFGHMTFDTPDGAKSSGNICWLTNLAPKRKPKELVLTKTFDAEEYPVLDGTDVILVRRSADIPMDYDGIMAVPTSYLGFHDPRRFEIVGHANWATYQNRYMHFHPRLDGKKVFAKILIRRV